VQRLFKTKKLSKVQNYYTGRIVIAPFKGN